MKNDIYENIGKRVPTDYFYTENILDYEIRIIAGFVCPLVYVVIPKNHPCYKVSHRNIDIKCHGGLTYSEMTSTGDYMIGWDYGHAGDYSIMGFCGRKYELNEILNDAKNVILQLEKIRNASKMLL